MRLLLHRQPSNLRPSLSHNDNSPAAAAHPPQNSLSTLRPPLTLLPCVLLLQQLPDRIQLHITRPLIDRPDLAIPPILLRQPFPHEPHATHPLHRHSRHLPRHLAPVQLRHRRILDEIQPGLLLPRRVEDQRPRGLDFRPGLRQLVLHALEIAHQGVELRAVVPHVVRGVFPRAEGQARHLRGDADPPFVQQADGVFVAFAFLAEQRIVRDHDIVEVQDAGRGRLDAELFLFLRDAEAGGRLRFHHEGRDALVALGRIEIGEDDEKIGFVRVRDPHLSTVDLVPVRCLLRARPQREGVGAGRRLGQAEGAEGARGEFGQPFALALRGPVFEDRRVDKRIVHVYHDAHAWIHACELFNADYAGGEVHPCAAVFFGDLNAHEALFEELLNN